MATIEDQTATLDEIFKSALIQWQTYNTHVRAIATDLRKAREETAALRRRLEEKNGEFERLREENRKLHIQLKQTVVVKAPIEPDDEHFSIPATQIFASASAASKERSSDFTHLIQEHQEQAVTIATLTELLRLEREKSQRWRLQYNISSSPAPSSPPRKPPASGVRAARPGSHSPSHFPYPSTAFDPRPFDCDYAQVSASPELPKPQKAKPVYSQLEALYETSGNSRKKRKTPSRDPEAIALLAECSEDHSHKFRSNTSFAKSDSNLPTPKANQRLGNLLSDPKGRSRPRLSGPDSFLPSKRNANLPNSPPRRPRFLKPKANMSMANPEDEEPFRARPVHRLSLIHFKINPNVNEGLDFAYQEVVRNHHARKCLTGCTDKCCVDKWKALAHTLYNTDNRGDETLDEHISNNSLLLDMLGPNSEEKIRTLTPIARANLVEEARVRAIAARYSKHRAAHPRATSPPGFWATDMANSQETAELREKAEKLEREEVERRYQDAMKDNGRWVFADE